MNLSHVRLLVSNFSECFCFYRDVMGLEAKFGDEKGVYADFQVGTAKIALFKRELMAEAVGTTSKVPTAETQDVVAVIIAVPDVDEAYHSLLKRGATFLAAPHDRPGWGIRCAHLRDPAGNLIEINQELG